MFASVAQSLPADAKNFGGAPNPQNIGTKIWINRGAIAFVDRLPLTPVHNPTPTLPYKKFPQMTLFPKSLKKIKV